jgi:hypothetical protein
MLLDLVRPGAFLHSHEFAAFMTMIFTDGP